jgi:hypothetical protein
LVTACSFDTSYEPNGMSATTIGRLTPRVTHCVMNTISSSDTATVDSRPWRTMPEESPTRIRSTPAASASCPLGASYAVTITIFSPRRFISISSVRGSLPAVHDA